MLAEALKANSVQKLKGILAQRYGMELKLSFVVSAVDADASGMKSVVKDDALHVSISAQGKYLATAILPKAGLLSSNEKGDVSEMIRLVLEPTLYSLYLESEEQNFKNQISASHENVVPLFETQSEFSETIIYLENHNPQTTSRVALHLHEAGQRWAFLNYMDIRNQLNSTKDIKELGPLSLFIPDILQLSFQEQALVVEFLQDANSKNEPLILVGCAVPVCNSMVNQLLDQKLLLILKKNKLELDRLPREFSTLKEALELFLDRKAMLI